jgi:hypothetical protein
LENLVQSNLELCTALRLIGRQMLRYEKQDGESLNRVRKVLKRAENIRRTLRVPNESLETEKSETNADSPSEYIPEQEVNEAAVGKDVQRKGRLVRPRSLRLLKFPG